MTAQLVWAGLGKRWREDRRRRDHRLELGFHTDMRLAGIAVVLWCWTALGFARHWQLGQHVFELALALIFTVALTLLGLALGRKGLATVVAVCCAVVLLQTSNVEARNIAESSRALWALDGQQARISGTVTQARKIDATTQLVTLRADEVQYRQTRSPLNRSITFFNEQSQVAAGGEIEVLGEVRTEASRITLARPWIRSQEQAEPKILSFKNDLAAYLQQRIGSDPAALTLGLAYGDDSLLGDTARENFKVSGLTHLTAVSGSNISLIFVLAYRALQYFRIPRKFIIGVALLSTLLYAVFVGWEGSVIRSWAMGSLGAWALVLGHGKNITAVLSTTVTALLLALPELALNLGFLLSSLATASLILLAPALARLIAVFLPQPLAELLAIPSSATLWCTPVLIPLQEKIGFYSVFANMLATPLVPALTLCGLLLALAYLTGLGALSDLLADLGQKLAQLLLHIAEFFARAPGASLEVEHPLQASLLALLLAVLVSGVTVVADFLLFGKPSTSAFERKSLSL